MRMQRNTRPDRTGSDLIIARADEGCARIEACMNEGHIPHIVIEAEGNAILPTKIWDIEIGGVISSVNTGLSETRQGEE
jgi:hypothetical protein